MNSNVRDESPETNREAEFTALLARCEPQLAACVHAMLPVWQDAEEVLQETRMTLWRQFESFQPGSNFLAWARTVAWYLARASLRTGRRQREIFSQASVDALLTQLAATPEEENRRWEAFLECGKKLGAAARELLGLVYMENRKIKDVAEQLGRSTEGTYVTLSRIRRALIECMEQRLGQEDQ